MRANSYVLDTVNSSNFVKKVQKHNPDKVAPDSTPDDKHQAEKSQTFLNSIWKRLINYPQNFSESPNAPISIMIGEEVNQLASDSIEMVLSRKFEYDIDSQALSEAKESCRKIFHEDYPNDFILEYKGERLGMMMLDRCYDSKGEANLIYRFNPNIKSFRGLY